NDRTPLHASVIPTRPERSAIAPPEACASIPNQCNNSVVTAATQRINVLVIGCSRRGGHGTAVRKKKTGKISARANSEPDEKRKIAMVEMAASKQMDHKT